MDLKKIEKKKTWVETIKNSIKNIYSNQSFDYINSFDRAKEFIDSGNKDILVEELYDEGSRISNKKLFLKFINRDDVKARTHALSSNPLSFFKYLGFSNSLR